MNPIELKAIMLMSQWGEVPYESLKIRNEKYGHPVVEGARFFYGRSIAVNAECFVYVAPEDRRMTILLGGRAAHDFKAPPEGILNALIQDADSGSILMMTTELVDQWFPIDGWPGCTCGSCGDLMSKVPKVVNVSEPTPLVSSSVS